MAEFAAAALTTIASTASQVGTAVAGTAGAFGAPAIPGLFSAAGALGGGLSTAASILSGGATVASVLATARAGQQKADNYTMQASDADIQANVESVQGLQRRTSIKASLLQALGQRDVATAASGVDLSFGTPAIARQQDIVDGERALSSDSDTTNFNRSRLMERAAGFRAMASGASAGSLVSASALALEGGARLLRRG